MLKPLTEKPGRALAAGSFTVAASGASATQVLALLGAHSPGHQAAQADPAPVAGTADWKPTPAAAVLAAALDHAPTGWSPAGATQQLATAPLPYSCPLPGAAASTSLSRDYTASGAAFRVTVQAYTAGLGAEALARQEANATVCAAADGSTTLWDLSGARPGVESKAASSVRAGTRTSVVSFRRGDVVVHVSGAAGAPLQALATAFDGGLVPRLAPVCAHQDSTAADAARSPFSSTGYRAYTVAAKATIPDVPLPSTAPAAMPAASPTGPAPDPTASAAPAAVPVPIPAPNLVDHTAEPMAKPAGHAVSPAMPDPVALPAAPAAPAPKAVTEATVQVPAEDADGPGCGWPFTGMKPVPFDRDAAQRTTADLLTAAKAKLAADAKAWQDSVLAYWTGYAAYTKAAAAYNAYRDQVDSVNRSWTAIEAKWDAFDQAEQAYEQKVKDRQDFLYRQDAARKDFDAQTAACTAPAPSPSPSATPSPTANPTPSPTASPSPSPSSSTSKPGCPPSRPAIPDQAAPQMPDAPAKPADPAG